MVKISAVVITYNEEKNIARCLESLKKVADDIVVIDSYSTDKTKEICLSYGVRFEEHMFIGHIEQKNYGITRTIYPYVLSLDADEELSPQLINSILKVKNNWTADGYTMNRLTNYCGKWIHFSGWYPDTKLRLWDSRKGHWGGINPHDCFIMGKNVKILHLKGNLLHYSYSSIDDHLKQVSYFTNISANQYFKQNKKNNIMLKLFIAPIFKFIKHYILKLGFLDGYYGYVISKISSYAVFIKYAKIRELKKNAKRLT
ncbi:MAG TPA: glycosyltransferase family 2 protein [Bacteroidales bacterium]|nr:glycosyltransferase family 2 protein [Bacteroidales bacterium]